MEVSTEQRIRDIKRALKLMKWWAKEKDRRYRKQKKFAEKLFAPVVKYIQQQQNEK